MNKPDTPELFRVSDGLLRWHGEELRLPFQLEISRHGNISIVFDPLHYTSSDKWIERYELLERLHRGENRLIPFFHLSGTLDDGTVVYTDYAELRNFGESFSQDEIRLDPTATAYEINFDYTATLPQSPPTEDLIEYLTRGQLGFAAVTAETPLGTLSASGPQDIKTYVDEFGAVCVQRDSDAEEPDWIDRCDSLVDWTLQLLSLAQGRYLNWSGRRVWAGDVALYRTVRSIELREQTLANLFHHLNLRPIIELAARSHRADREEQTALSVAISWMLSSTSSVESRYLHLLVALEHLIDVLGSRLGGVIPKGDFRAKLREPFQAILDELARKKALTDEDRSFFAKKIAVMNRPTFYQKILRLIDQFDVPVADIRDEIKGALVDCRNDLVHRGLLHRLGDDTKAIHRNCDIAEEFMKRTIMAILGYRGQFVSALYDLDSYQFEEGNVFLLNSPKSREPPS